MSAEPGVRPAGAADLEAVVEIERQALPEPWTVAGWREELQHADALVLVAGEPAAGYAAFRVRLGEGELLRIGVVPGARRRGLATRLLTAGLAAIRQRGAATCHLEVRAHNHGAIAFYRRHGFSETGRRPRYYADGTDALLLSRAL